MENSNFLDELEDKSAVQLYHATRPWQTKSKKKNSIFHGLYSYI